MSKLKHNCIEKIREKSKLDNPNIESIWFDLDRIANADGSGEFMTGQRIEIKYSNQAKTEKTFITHTYCPFCGKKYKE